MVASAHPVAAFIGLTILQRGGNAFDAAIAVAAAEGVVLPMKCGLGGDAFVVLHDAKKREMVAFNGSGVAAAGATADYYRSRGHKSMPLKGVHSVSVPGAVSVYEAFWKRYCTMPWAELWAPAIRLAEEGLAITAYISARYADEAETLARYPYSAAQFLPKGRAPEPGERWAAPNLARTLKAVAKGGADAFYRGEIAEKMLAFLKAGRRAVRGGRFRSAAGGHLQPDLDRLSRPDRLRDRSAVAGLSACSSSSTFSKATTCARWSLSAPSACICSSRRRSSRSTTAIASPAIRLSSNGRWSSSSPRSTPRCAAARSISSARAQPQGALVAEHGGDTSYFAVADGDGNAVSFIHSLSNAFGSAVVAGDTGVTFNNRAGRGFSLDPDHPNVIAPGRRTMHTLNAYLICRDGQPWLVGGTPGGDQQTQWSTQMITGVVDHGMSLQEAVEAPRWHSFPGTDPAEPRQAAGGQGRRARARGFPQGACRARHTVQTLKPWSGGGAVQLIQFDHEKGVLRGASDPRPGGLALGL